MRRDPGSAIGRSRGPARIRTASGGRAPRSARPAVTIALTGGTGFVGQALLDRAAIEGIDVRALARRPQPDRPGVTWFAGDLGSPKALARMMRGSEAVVHVAGVVNTPDPAQFESGNVTGTLNVIEAAIRAGVPRLVFVSSLSAREPELSMYGASKARAEKLVKASGLDWTIVRPPAIYGPRDEDMFQLFWMAKWGVVPVPVEGRVSMIHVDDLARLLLALIPGGEDVTHKVFEPDDGKPQGWTHDEMARAIGWAVGKRVRVIGLRKGLMQRAAKADMTVRRENARLTLDRVGYMMHPDWVVSTGARVPGTVWQPRIESREGLRSTALWYRANGKL
ncbi:MAG: NAD(P)-dependent oxidoreductase [Sphingomonadales bacterium]|nr:NAD(P)-dependent oxidoreductase [Sphingomonadales bacterium]